MREIKIFQTVYLLVEVQTLLREVALYEYMLCSTVPKGVHNMKIHMHHRDSYHV